MGKWVLINETAYKFFNESAILEDLMRRLASTEAKKREKPRDAAVLGQFCNRCNYWLRGFAANDS
ncbi:hypothetical protein RvVAR0630_43380 [Agrobacterium vitis]|nr:hypothetical protein RvVAR0630_43380 [Agrobacterium vitis]